MLCHIAGPTLCDIFAPVYWATKVLEYAQVPKKKLTIVKLIIAAGIEAAKVSAEYQDKNILSTNCCMVREPVLKMRGKAITST